MKCQKLITIILLGILTGMSSNLFARTGTDSLLLERIFSYKQNYTPIDINGHTSTVYIKRNFNVWRRNFTLWLIPSMYSIAEGDRSYLSETYNRIKFKDYNDYDRRQQISFSTIRHNRHTMSVTTEFLTPNIYGVCLYDNHVLSPFNRNNRHYYRYHIQSSSGDSVIISFKPRLFKNTQLVSGDACVNISTGRVIRTSIDGEYDMMRFHSETTQGDGDVYSLLPKHCKTHLVFKFMGNEVYFNNEAVYDCPELPDSINDVFSPEKIEKLRPVRLTAQEQLIFDQWKERNKPDTTVVEDTVHHFNFAKDVLQDAIGDNLISSIRFESKRARMKLSPIIDPQYISYSSTHGFAYKLKLGAFFSIDTIRSIELQPWCGYNFKYKKFYFTIPVYYTYNPERNGQLMVIYGNGNRIGNASIIEEIQREHQDTLKLDDKDLDYFDDNYLTISNNIQLTKEIELTTGFMYHRRVPFNPEEMWHFGKPQVYKSFAPMITLRLHPLPEAPLITIDYERGLKGVLGSDIDYERWEFDGSWKYEVKPMRILNARFGYGFYTRKKTNYFVDYMHFRDNKLPGGWDDDWSGDFQLLNSSWYNASNYYARTHFSYESPLLVGSWLPLLGHIIEKERFYFSALSIRNTRPYYEFGYGFSTRFLSIGLFTSFLSSEFQSFDCKFTFELFRRW